MRQSHHIADQEEQSPLRVDGSNQFSEKDERLVWQRFIEGDDQSLIYIYSKYVDVLYSYGKQISKRYELIRDSIQELFCDLIDQRTKLSSARSVKAYLFASLKRRILKEIKSNSKLRMEDEGFSFSIAETTLAFSGNLKETDFAIINQKLNLLSVNQREAIYLHFYEGLSYTEIAEILNIKVSSTRILTYRALDNLQKHLGPYLSSFYTLIICLSHL